MSTEQTPMERFAQQLNQRKQANANEPAWLQQFRDSAWTRFSEMGIPTKKYEEWQYINVAPIAKHGYKSVREGALPSLTKEAFVEAVETTHQHRMVFLDGVFLDELSHLPTAPEGGYIGSLAVALKGDSEQHLHELLGRLLDGRVKNPFTYLNMALFEDGAYLSIPKGAKVETPIEMIFVATGSEADLAFHPRNIIEVAEGASVSLVERYVSLSPEANYWSNPATAFFIAESAQVEHVKLQQEATSAPHIAQVHVEQGRESVLNSLLFSLGASSSRHEVETVLDGASIACNLSGLYLAQAGQHMDNRICMEHRDVQGTSDQYFKGILDGSGSGAFSGRILVQKPAQKTDAYQTHQAMLLTDDASVSSKPQLEIYADDVKCSHGATTGNLDETALFYLRSRGIPKRQSEQMLMVAFAQEVLDRIGDEALREQLTGLLEERLAVMQEK